MNTTEFALLRFNGSSAYTAGKLYENGRFLCNTLEDQVREIDGQPVKSWKIPGQTAIPRGRYEIVLTHSPRFGRILPELKLVPGFTAIRMHRGNTAKDTEGCPLVGMIDGNDLDSWLGNSTLAENLLIDRIKHSHSKGCKTFITIV